MRSNLSEWHWETAKEEWMREEYDAEVASLRALPWVQQGTPEWWERQKAMGAIGGGS